MSYYGLLGRSYYEPLDAVFGVNMYFDQRDTGLFTYNQLGWGWELLGNGLEARQNFYHPVGTQRNLVGTGINGGGLIGFQGNNLMFGEDRFFEQSLRGFDFEVGGEVPGTGNVIDGFRPVRAYLGTYYYDNPGGETDVAGISSRVNIQNSGLLDFNVFLTHDDLYNTNAGVGITFWLDGRNFADDGPNLNERVIQRILDATQRKSNVTTARVESLNNAVPVTMGGAPVRFVHVADGNSDGTFEDPLSDVADVFAFSQPGDIIYVHGGSVFNGQGPLVLQDNQRLLGEGIAHMIDTDQFGTIPIPAVNGGPAPVIRNSTGNAIVMANGNEISNFIINDAIGNGICGVGVTDFNINNVIVRRSGENGLNVAGSSGTGLLTDSRFVESSLANAVLAGSSLDVMIVNNEFVDSDTGSGLAMIFTGPLTGTIDNNNGNDNGDDDDDDGFEIAAASFTGDFTNNTARRNADDGIEWDVTGTFDGNYTGNTSTDNDDDGHDLVIGTVAAGSDFSDNTGNDNEENGFQIDIGSFAGSFNDNTARRNGGDGLFWDGSSFDGSFSRNTANENDGNGFHFELASVINNSLFDDNTANDNGDGLGDDNGILMDVTSFNGRFTNNTANRNTRDGIEWNGENFTGLFDMNTANDNAFDGFDLSITTITMGDFTNNTALRNAASAVFLIPASGFDFEFTDFTGNFSGNTVRDTGLTASVTTTNGFDISGTNFTGDFNNNTSNANGNGSVLANGFQIDITNFDGNMDGNTANDNVGNGFNYSGDTFVGSFSENTANDNLGQGIFAAGHGFNLDIGDFDGNMDENVARRNNGDGFNYSGDTFEGTFSNNLGNNNGSDGFELDIASVVNGSTFDMNTANANDGDGFNFDNVDNFNGTFSNNIARNNDGDGFFWDGDTFVGTFTGNTAAQNGFDGFDLEIDDFGSDANPVTFTDNRAANNGDHGFEMTGDLFVGTIDGNRAIDNTTDDGMFLDYDRLVARITNNRFQGNGNSGNEAGLYIVADNGTTSTVLIENNNFGNDSSTENEVGLHVAVDNGTMNLHVINNTFFTDDESIRIVSERSFGADGTVNLNIFDNDTNNAYQLIRETGIGPDGVFRLGFEPGMNENDVADQIATNRNTTNGVAPPSTSISGENTSGSDYQFIMRNTIPLPPVFP